LVVENAPTRVLRTAMTLLAYSTARRAASGAAARL
jgi:hypothetical protein